MCGMGVRMHTVDGGRNPAILVFWLVDIFWIVGIFEMLLIKEVWYLFDVSFICFL